MPKVRHEFEWHGPKVEAKVRKAVEMASVKWGVTVAQKARGIVHRLSGTLSRSLHAAPDDYNIDDTATAMVALMPLKVGEVPKWVGDIAKVAAGSWVDYAIFEKALGGKHDYLTGPKDEAIKDFPNMLKEAFRRQGLQ